MSKIEFVTSKGTTLLLDQKFIEANIYDRNQTTGEKLLTKSELLIDRVSSGYYLVVDLHYHINAALHAKYYIDEDVTKAFRIKFVDRVDGTVATINEALKVVGYSGVLPITDLNDTFMKIVSFNTTKIGVVQSPDQPFIYVSRSAAANVQLQTGYSTIVYDKVVFKRGDNNINYDTSTGYFSFAQPGVYLLIAHLSCTTGTESVNFTTDFRQATASTSLYSATNDRFNVKLVSYIYLSPTGYTYPVTNFIVRWSHNNSAASLAYDTSTTADNLTYCQIAFIG
jgi:hypothetical protein